MTNVIVIALLALILGLAIGYIVRAKKKGAKCIGCPYSQSCSSHSCSCSKESE